MTPEKTNEPETTLPPYDALLIVSFGGPEGPDEVLPFLENVTRGRAIPRERLLEVAEHYQLFGGVSPLNAQNRALIKALVDDFARDRLSLPIYWGNRNWRPFLVDAVKEMADAGVRRALAFVTSAYSSYSSCRQYLDDIERARQVVGDQAPPIDKLRAFFNHPGFIEPMAERVAEALAELPVERRDAAEIVFTAHSIPQAMAAGSAYEVQLTEAARLVASSLGHKTWRLVYQSRSGPPTQPWLEPDVEDYLVAAHAAGVRDVVLAPIGFLSDHMEVIYDLDVRARALCDRLGLGMVRAATVGTHPRFVSMIGQLIHERIDGHERLAIGEYPAPPDICPADCCPRPQPVPHTPGKPVR